MIKVFVDANVWIAGAGSATGGSRQILDWAERRLVQVVVSHQVLEEARDNVADKLPQALPAFERIIKAVQPRNVRQPGRQRVVAAEQIIHPKDAPILAAAFKGKVDYLVTLDRRHFKTPSVQAQVPFPVLLPEEFVPLLRPQVEPEPSEEL